MKKLLLALVFMFPLSVFAGADTDRICADDTKYGLIQGETSFQVSYPGEVASVGAGNIGKVFFRTNPKESTMDVEGYYALYYVVNIGQGSNRRAELYTYNCATKKPNLLLTTRIDVNKEDVYRLGFVGNMNLVIIGSESGMGIGPARTIIGYDFYTHKRLFSYTDVNDLIGEGEVQGLVSSSNAWYMYFVPSGFFQPKSYYNEILYKIDKRTKRVTKI